MKNFRYVFFIAMIAVLTGCATTAGKTGFQAADAVSDDDGAIKQKTEFKDLPVELQTAILHGGGGD